MPNREQTHDDHTPEEIARRMDRFLASALKMLHAA